MIVHLCPVYLLLRLLHSVFHWEESCFGYRYRPHHSHIVEIMRTRKDLLILVFLIVFNYIF